VNVNVPFAEKTIFFQYFGIGTHLVSKFRKKYDKLKDTGFLCARKLSYTFNLKMFGSSI